VRRATTRWGRLVTATLVIAAVAGGPASGQQRPQPQLMLSILAGTSNGTRLWQNVLQPLALIEDPFATDTLVLGRELTPPLILGASATYFPSTYFGLTGEIAFLGYGRDDTCTMYNTDQPAGSRGYNEQVCNDIASQSGSASMMAFTVGALLRAAPRSTLKPYIRAQAGLTYRSASTVEVAGRFIDETGTQLSRLVIQDPDPGSTDPVAMFGLGAMFAFAQGYQARLELRDHLLFSDRITGPANGLGEAPMERYLFNSVGLIFMLDVVLEQRRGRRY
jgi:hypothetical protein